MIPETVTARGVVLRPWTPAEAPLYLELRDDLIFRFTTEPPELDEDQCRSNIESAIEDPDQAPFAICDENQTVIGNLSASRRGDTAVIAYWLAAGGRGKGNAAEALRAATAWAFEHWHVSGAELEVDPENAASLHVAAAAGYRRQAIRLSSSCGGPAIVLRRAASPVAEPPS
jgi:ribosomal-protein-alanine N-acetyltransferase